MSKFPKLQIFVVSLYFTLAKKITIVQKDIKILPYSVEELCRLHNIVFGFSQDHTVFL